MKLYKYVGIFSVLTLVLIPVAASGSEPSSAETPVCSDLILDAASNEAIVSNQSLCVMPGVTATTTYDTTGIWSGVNVSSPTRTYSQVVGRLLVPSRKPTSCAGSTLASWVGIGGVNSANLIQAGLAYVKGSSFPQAFYEISSASQPGALTIFNMVIKPGDTVHMSATFIRSVGIAELSVSDLATGISRTADIDVIDSTWDGTTAEWVDERLTLVSAQGTTTTPLVDFGTNAWFGAKVIKSDGLWHSMASENNVIFDMENGSHQLAHPDSGFLQSMNWLDSFDS